MTIGSEPTVMTTLFQNAGWALAIACFSTVFGAILHWLVTRNRCTTCGLEGLKTEIKRLCSLVRYLLEEAGVKYEKQLDIIQKTDIE